MEICTSYEENWYICKKRIPKQEIVFFSQVTVIFIIIITCIVNLSIKNGDSNLWVALLSSSLGYILPNPRVKNKIVLPIKHNTAA